MKDLNYNKTEATQIIDNVINQIKTELIWWRDVMIKWLFMLSVKDAMWRNVVSPTTWKVHSAKIYKKIRCTFSKTFRNTIKWSK